MKTRFHSNQQWSDQNMLRHDCSKKHRKNALIWNILSFPIHFEWIIPLTLQNTLKANCSNPVWGTGTAFQVVKLVLYYLKDCLYTAEGPKKPLKLHNPRIKKLSPTDLGVKGSARQGWVVDLAPIDLQSCQNVGVISTPLPIKLLYLTPSGLKREGVKSGCPGALKPDRLGLSRKANKCSDAHRFPNAAVQKRTCFQTGIIASKRDFSLAGL